MSFTALLSRRFFRSKQTDRFVSLITFISVVGVMLGTAALIITLSVLGGFAEEITSKVIGFTSHLQIQGFQNQPLRDPGGSVARLKQEIPLIRNIIPFVSREAIIRSREGVDGILLKGVPPRAAALRVRRYLVEGTGSLVAGPGDLPGLIIGR